MADPADRQTAKELRRKARSRFATANRLEAEYLRALRQLTKQIDQLVKGMAPEDLRDSAQLEQALRRYSELVKPWAKSIAAKMVARVARVDENAWVQMGRTMGKELRKELNDAPVGEALRLFLSEQVHLITSLPLDAAERVHKLTMEGMTGSRRASEVMKEIMETGSVTESRARLIARTETARTAAGLTMVRAQHVGSTHYIWRTAKDGDVRDSHKQMEGQVVAWDNPPTLSDGTTTHAGMIYNCRCYAEPILTED